MVASAQKSRNRRRNPTTIKYRRNIVVYRSGWLRNRYQPRSDCTVTSVA
jgi:hypothetical protein